MLSGVADDPIADAGPDADADDDDTGGGDAAAAIGVVADDEDVAGRHRGMRYSRQQRLRTRPD